MEESSAGRVRPHPPWCPSHSFLGPVDLVLQPVVAPQLLVVIVRLERGHKVLDPRVGELAESEGLAGPRRELSKSLALVHRVLIADRVLIDER